MPYDVLKDKKTELIRKARDGSAFLAPYSTAALTAITTGSSADLVTLPTGYKDLGWCSADGAKYARATTESNVKSFGSVEATRSDITSDTITMDVTAQETKLLTLGLYTGADLSATKAAFTTGEFQVEKPSRPSALFYRLLGLFVDDGDAGEIYVGRYMPRAKVTSFAEQQFTDGDVPISYGVTFSGYEDSVLGYSHKWFFGGPGWKALLTQMSIIQATS